MKKRTYETIDFTTMTNQSTMTKQQMTNQFTPMTNRFTPLNNISPIQKKTPEKTPTTEITNGPTTINWSRSPIIIKHPRIMEQASTITQWKLIFPYLSEKGLPLGELQMIFPNSEVKNGSLFIKGIQGITPAARFFSNGSLTCASCSHISNVQRGNEIIQIMKDNEYTFTVEYKGDKASTYNGNLFISVNGSSNTTNSKLVKRYPGNPTKKKRKNANDGFKVEKTIRLDELSDILNKKTGWNVTFNPELQNCLTIAMPNYSVKWTEKNHYKFSSTFNAKVFTLLLCMKKKRLNNHPGLVPEIVKKIIYYLAMSEQCDQIKGGESHKQGSLRIFGSGSVTGLGIKNCELLQDVVEKIHTIIIEHKEQLLN